MFHPWFGHAATGTLLPTVVPQPPPSQKVARNPPPARRAQDPALQISRAATGTPLPTWGIWGSAFYLSLVAFRTPTPIWGAEVFTPWLSQPTKRSTVSSGGPRIPTPGSACWLWGSGPPLGVSVSCPSAQPGGLHEFTHTRGAWGPTTSLSSVAVKAPTLYHGSEILPPSATQQLQGPPSLPIQPGAPLPQFRLAAKRVQPNT